MDLSQNEQIEMAIRSSSLEASRKTTCWAPKAMVDGQYGEGFDKSWFVIVWHYYGTKQSYTRRASWTQGKVEGHHCSIHGRTGL